MIDQNFFTKKVDYLTLEEVLDITNAKLNCDSANKDQKVYNINTLAAAKNDEISFLNNPKYISTLNESEAGFCLIEEKYSDKLPNNIIALIIPDPYFAYCQLLKAFYIDNKDAINDKIVEKSGAFIASSALIGENSIIKPGAYIGPNVEIGKNCVIGANSVINQGVKIGDNCKISDLVSISCAKIGKNTIIHNGTMIGQDGFGFAHHEGFNHKILQLGRVIIGSDVEIGANSCIDRGAIEDTVIGDNCKIDNLVQIAHNVTLGRGCFIAGTGAIAGSVVVEDFVQIGGNASIAGHLRLGFGAKIAGNSGVIKDVAPGTSVGGLPAVPIRDWHRINIKLLQLIKRKK